MTWTQRVQALLGVLATLMSIISFVWQFSQQPEHRVMGPWSTLVLAFVSVTILALLPSDRTRIRWRLLHACRKLKQSARETIDIAAGDCSWLLEEWPLIKDKLDNGVKVRLLCRRPASPPLVDAINRLATYPNATVCTFALEEEEVFRCILIDSKKADSQRVLVIDKQTNPGSVMGVFSFNRHLVSVFSTEHSARYMDGHSRNYRIIRLLYERLFSQGKPWASVQETHHV